MQAQFWNAKNSKLENWFIDSESSYNTAGRWMNDAGDYEGVPDIIRTEFKTNIAFKTRISRNKHKEIGKHYIEMYCIDPNGIAKGSELFVQYGIEFWLSHLNI